MGTVYVNNEFETVDADIRVAGLCAATACQGFCPH